ncbi:hypothetical protein Syun_020687 [Stephania yunnanensis]|uniref:Uncharacterized protein n=1 Tax=Stephania yunnanensis TaxID=152371 RepID=A0AAP0NQ91_9MAGN
MGRDVRYARKDLNGKGKARVCALHHKLVMRYIKKSFVWRSRIKIAGYTRGIGLGIWKSPNGGEQRKAKGGAIVLKSNLRAELMRATPAKPRRETPTDWVVACLINSTEEQMASNAKLSCGFIPSSPGLRQQKGGQQEDGENAQGTLVGIEPQDDFRMDDSSEADSDEGTPIDDMDNADEDN